MLLVCYQSWQTQTKGSNQFVFRQNMRFYRLSHLGFELRMQIRKVQSEMVQLLRVIPVDEGLNIQIWLFKLLLYFLHNQQHQTLKFIHLSIEIMYQQKIISKAKLIYVSKDTIQSRIHPRIIKQQKFGLYKQLISLIMKLTYCQQHPNQEVLLVCLQPSCTSKLLCLHCTNQHYRHDIVSLQHFATQIVAPLQRNRNNPHRTQIVKQLNAVMQSMVNKLHQARNKINALIGDCEDKLQQYFGKLLSSFSVPSQQYIKQQIDNSLSSALIADLLSQVAKVQKMVMGTFQETNMLTYHTKQLFQQKMSEMLTTSSQAINSLKAFILQISFAKPEKYELSFNRQKMQKGSFIVSDEGLSLQRVIGNGGFPLCLSASPFSPLHTRFSIKIQKTANNRSICMGACLQNVVRNNSFTNCCGFGKGIYAIDQNSPYSSGTMMASWNHHDTHFNQTHVGSNDLVGWTFHQGDTLTLSLDYYNSVLAFIKPTEGQDEEVLLYQMPIKLDAGPIYPFVSMANKGDVVSIVEVQEVD